MDGQDPKQRLHDTIKCLNRRQLNCLIQFGGDGTSEGVIWRFTPMAHEILGINVAGDRLRRRSVFGVKAIGKEGILTDTALKMLQLRNLSLALKYFAVYRSVVSSWLGIWNDGIGGGNERRRQ